MAISGCSPNFSTLAWPAPGVATKETNSPSSRRSSTQEGDDGFGTLLRAAMAANVDKLREARPRETHLVVTLDHRDLSPDPVRTPAPELLDGIDVLWVLLGYFNAKWTYRLWRTTASDRRWHLRRHPLGKPPAAYRHMRLMINTS